MGGKTNQNGGRREGTLKNKLNAKRETVDGHSFPSQAEAKRYRELRLLEKAGKIRYLILQPRFDMPIGARYTPDFEYEGVNGERFVEEVKGMRTEAFNLRLKCFHYFYPSVKLLINGVDSRAKKTKRRNKKIAAPGADRREGRI